MGIGLHAPSWTAIFDADREARIAPAALMSLNDIGEDDETVPPWLDYWIQRQPRKRKQLEKLLEFAKSPRAAELPATGQ